MQRYRTIVSEEFTTTNLRLPRGPYDELRHEAQRRRTSVASVVRMAVAQYPGHTHASAAIPFGEDPADAQAGSVDADASDESVNHEHYLYRWPKEVERDAARGRGGAAGVSAEE